VTPPDYREYRLPSGQHGMTATEVAANQRWRLIGAAAEIFAEHGLAGTRSRSIAQRAGVSSSTFYERFEDLEEIHGATVAVAAESVAGILADACEGHADAVNGIPAVVEAGLEFAAAEPALVAMLGVELIGASAAVAAERERVATEIGGLMRKARAGGADRPAAVDRHLVAGALSVALDRLEGDDAPARRRLAGELSALLA
jgi:TetR/AcrR family transcriptional regulator, cholesterol catabolism regulator